MAGFKERISLLIDVDSKGAVGGLQSLKTSIREAEGFSGKLKAGVIGLGDQLKSFVSSPAGAAVAIAAVGSAAFNAASDAANLGLDIGRLKDATKLSADEASRWVEVGGDLGLSVDQVSGFVGKMVENLGKTPEKFKAMGVEMKYAKDGTVDINSTLIDAIGTINSVQDPTKRAALAAQLFGKSWKDSSELIGLSADEIKKRLAGVGDAKVYSDKQIEDSRAFRDSMEDFKDITGDLVTSIGKELVPVVTDLIKAIGDISGPLGGFGGLAEASVGQLSGWAGGLKEIAGGFEHLGGVFGGVADNLDHRLIPAMEDSKAATEHARLEHQDATKAAGALGTANIGLSGDVRRAKEAFEGAATATREMDRRYSELTGKIDDKQAWLDLQDALDDYKAKMGDAEASDRDKERSGLAVQEELIGRLQAIKNLPDEKQTAVLTLIDQGKFDEAAWAIGVLTAERDLVINPKLGKGADGSFKIVAGARASGGPVTAGQPYIVGENRPELFVPDSNGTILPSVPTGGAGGGGGSTINLTINTTERVDGAMIVRELKTYERRNGPGWRA